MLIEKPIARPRGPTPSHYRALLRAAGVRRAEVLPVHQKALRHILRDVADSPKVASRRRSGRVINLFRKLVMNDPERPIMGAFPTTHWSLVVRAGHGDAKAQREALVQLLTRYQPALRRHLILRKGMQHDRADDLLQGFLASKILEQGIIERAEKEKGKFRSFLLTALDRFVVSEVRKERAQKRGSDETISLAEDADMARTVDAPDEQFDVAWARQLLAEAIRRMKDECTGSGRADVWGVFETRVLNPLLHGAPPMEYDELVAKFGLTSPTQASNLLVTGKRSFARVLRGLVGEYAKDPTEIDAEINDLTEILSKARD